jgi:hypothetical protein
MASQQCAAAAATEVAASIQLGDVLFGWHDRREGIGYTVQPIELKADWRCTVLCWCCALPAGDAVVPPLCTYTCMSRGGSCVELTQFSGALSLPSCLADKPARCVFVYCEW